MTRCPNCVDVLCDAFDTLDDDLLAQAGWAREVDQAVTAYRRKLAGREPFTDFEAMVPPLVRDRGQA